jgi:hypothetical protein
MTDDVAIERLGVMVKKYRFLPDEEFAIGHAIEVLRYRKKLRDCPTPPTFETAVKNPFGRD